MHSHSTIVGDNYHSYNNKNRFALNVYVEYWPDMNQTINIKEALLDCYSKSLI
jgi:hypothetical protein